MHQPGGLPGCGQGRGGGSQRHHCWEGWEETKSGREAANREGSIGLVTKVGNWRAIPVGASVTPLPQRRGAGLSTYQLRQPLAEGCWGWGRGSALQAGTSGFSASECPQAAGHWLYLPPFLCKSKNPLGFFFQLAKTGINVSLL